MTTTEVYSSTTAPNPPSSCFQVPSEHLDWIRFILKVLQVLLSLVALLLEELVHSCTSCLGLYAFEFVSCSALLFTLLLLVLLATPLHGRVGISRWPIVDFVYSCVIFVLFFIASIAFTADNGGSQLEKAALVFGFLASLLFAADVVMFYRRRGFPFGVRQSSNGGQPGEGADPVTQQPEMENLNTNTDPAE